MELAHHKRYALISGPYLMHFIIEKIPASKRRIGVDRRRGMDQTEQIELRYGPDGAAR